MKDIRIIVVNGEDKIINYLPRSVVDAQQFRYRVSALWITNSKGDILLARRAYTKSHNPGQFGPAVSGTLEKGETYKSNIIKEAEEELGIKNIRFKKGPKEKINGKYNYFGQWYTCVIDKPTSAFKIQKEEVAEIKWFSRKELLKQLKEHPNEFITDMRTILKVLHN